MRKVIIFILNILICYLPLNATIIKTTQIKDVTQEVSNDTLVLFNIAEVLMDTETSLGTQAWRKYVRSRVDAKLHDALTLYVFRNVPPRTPEPMTAQVIKQLQKQNIPVFAFTSRGRHEWYSSQVEAVDLLTEKLLRQIEIDFSKTSLPTSLTALDSEFSEFFHEGIIYATNAFEKGDILLKLLDKTQYHPPKIVFIDDKADSLKTVESAMEEIGIPFTGYAYSRTAKEHANFDPMIAHIQLDLLLSSGKILSDEEAEQIKIDQFSETDPETYFYQIIEKWSSKLSL